MFSVRHYISWPGEMASNSRTIARHFNAAATAGNARVSGATHGSHELAFIPQTLRPGDYHFDIGTAGSTTLVLQTILPALLTADAPSNIRLQGGTHNPLAPPFDFFERTFVPLINGMGPRIQTRQQRPGFFPVGGGIVEVSIEPAPTLQPLTLPERGPILSQQAWALLSRLPEHIAQRELNVISRQLDLPANALELRHVDARGPGNAVLVEIRSQHVSEVFSGIGERGIRAESVAQGVVTAVRRYLAADVPVAEHLADQLLLPLALAGAGRFVTLRPSLHTMTNIDVVEQFTGKRFTCEELAADRWRISF